MKRLTRRAAPLMLIGVLTALGVTGCAALRGEQGQEARDRAVRQLEAMEIAFDFVAQQWANYVLIKEEDPVEREKLTRTGIAARDALIAAVEAFKDDGKADVEEFEAAARAMKDAYVSLVSSDQSLEEEERTQLLLWAAAFDGVVVVVRIALA